MSAAARNMAAADDAFRPTSRSAAGGVDPTRSAVAGGEVGDQISITMGRPGVAVGVGFGGEDVGAVFVAASRAEARSVRLSARAMIMSIVARALCVR